MLLKKHSVHILIDVSSLIKKLFQQDLLHIVYIIQVSFVCPETRDLCSKMGRELLAEIMACHPFMLSFITQRVQEYMEKLGQVSFSCWK